MQYTFIALSQIVINIRYHLQQDFFFYRFWSAGNCALFYAMTAYPGLCSFSADISDFQPVCSSIFRTMYKSGKKVVLLIGSFFQLDIFTSFFQNPVCIFPQFFIHNCRDMGTIVFIHHPFIFRQEFLFLSKEINYFYFSTNIVTLIFRISDNIGNHMAVNPSPFIISVSTFP